MPAPYFRRRIYSVETTELERGSSYATSDLYLAAYLFSVGTKLVKTARRDRQVTFVFEGAGMHDLRMAWHDGSGHVVAKAYVDALHNLKSLVRSG